MKRTTFLTTAAAAGTADPDAAMLEAGAVAFACAMRSRFRMRVCILPIIRMQTTKTAGHIASTAKILRTGRLVARISPAI